MKIIKIALSFTIILTILILSCFNVSANTIVDSTGSYDKDFFQTLMESSGKKPSECFSFDQLPADEYIVYYRFNYDTNNNGVSDLFFIPSSDSTINYISTTSTKYTETINNYNFSENEILVVEVEFVDEGVKQYRFVTQRKVYFYRISNSLVIDKTPMNFMTETYYNIFAYSSNVVSTHSNHIFFDNTEIFNVISENSSFHDFHKSFATIDSNGSSGELPSLNLIPNLMSYLTQIIPGYTGDVSVVDNSLATLIADKGISCSSDILKQYKYQITYCQNDDIKMMFLNNNKAPKYDISDYDGNYPNAMKYKFTYDNRYDTIVYFPTYQKYLHYDDWYNNKPESNDFFWVWEVNDKSFSLISDWNVSFSDSAPHYSGTRVILSWDNTSSSAKSSMSDAWDIDKEKLINQGWREGRPSDQNYPYKISYWQNGVPAFEIYMNSRPTIQVNRENEYQCEYKVQMIPQYGYIYSFWADCYSQFDYTTKITDGNDIVSQGQNYVWTILNTFGGIIDDSCMLHLYENYKGSTDPESTEYIGTKVFFNWDITTDMVNSNNDDNFDYSTLLDGGSKYVDDNGNIHGGSLSNYDKDDLNKYNDNGSSDKNNSSSNNGNFDFSYEGITAYCSQFFDFIKAVFNLFPAYIWLLIGVSISILIALRILGR